LIAIGEDYNLFLLARIDEERRHASPTKGVILALTRTGSIISSCGIIMAGTFAALMAGSLVGVKPLGFRVEFGVRLGPVIVGPILVPCYMILLERGLFGRWARYLGAVPKPHRLQTPPPAEFQKLPVDQ